MIVRFNLLLAIGSIFICSSALAQQDDLRKEVKPAMPTSPQDVVCGPRCVEFLLKTLRPETSASLVDIVSQVQPDFERGSSLGVIKRYLEAQGLYTLALQPARGSALVLPHLALVHIRPSDSTLGHFVVLLPNSDSNKAIVWSGQAGRLSLPMWELGQMIDGGMLLVGTSPFQNIPDFTKTTDYMIQNVAIGSIGVILLAILLLLRRVSKKVPGT